MKRTVISASGTSAITIGNRILFTVKSGDFKSGKPTLTVTNLAATENATITKSGQIVRNGLIDFDSGEGSVTLESPGEYGFHKSATVGDPDVEIENSI